MSPSTRARLLACAALVVAACDARHAAAPAGPTHGAPAVTAAAASSSAAAAPATFVGSSVCSGCHAPETQAWQGSHHALAMQDANASSMPPGMSGRQIREGGTEFLVQREGDAWRVSVRAAGQPARDLAIRYAFGLAPLQQYLVDAPGGRLQVLPIAWDSRPAATGGQHWFSLSAAAPRPPDDPSGWSGYLQNWNLMCADCHATDVHKNYDPSTREYRTAWSELAVGCEACHGAASKHVAWAREPEGARDPEAHRGFDTAFDERQGVAWLRDPRSHEPRRSTARTTDREIEACARCHSRRSQLTDAVTAADPLEDGFHPELLDRDAYFPDGQIREEDYEYASFLESRMYAAGVTCGDCHDPHGATLRAQGDTLCLGCHDAPRYATSAHHFHAAASPGARCIACHVPTRRYMRIHDRHDHSFRIPRPDRTVAFGVPNACNDCHRDRSAAWADRAIRAHHRRPEAGWQSFAENFAAFDAGDGRAAEALVAMALDTSRPAIVRASALARLGAAGVACDGATLARLARDPQPLVRRAAAEAAREAPGTLASLLADPLRDVRVEAMAGLLDTPRAGLSAEVLPRLAGAIEEYAAAQRFNADRPEGETNLGVLLAWNGDAIGARAAFAEALRIDPGFVAAAIDAADVAGAEGDEADAERVLRAALPRSGASGGVQHALALSLIRQHRPAEALPLLAEAWRREPHNARFAYLYAVALHDAGERARAIDVLDAALRRHPTDPDLRQARDAYLSAVPRPLGPDPVSR